MSSANGIDAAIEAFLKDHPGALESGLNRSDDSKNPDTSEPYTWKNLTVRQRNMLLLGPNTTEQLKKMVWNSWPDFQLFKDECIAHLKTGGVTGQQKELLAKHGAKPKQIKALKVRKVAVTLICI
ncbi:hypothetical protein Ndes2526B_g02815 [Nannochloris sp. 'desiccata']|nr:hypothetical protein NADE_004584 [Chlorella desiccata (nom. nud.)]